MENPDICIKVLGMSGQVTKPGLLIGLRYSHLDHNLTQVQKLAEVISFPEVVHAQITPPNQCYQQARFFAGPNLILIRMSAE